MGSGTGGSSAHMVSKDAKAENLTSDYLNDRDIRYQ
jgi:hypothetical protein